MSTRIILVNFSASDQAEHILGLLAERATETLKLSSEAFQPSGVDTPETVHLDGVARDEYGMLQFMDIHELLPESVQQQLFQSSQDMDA